MIKRWQKSAMSGIQIQAMEDGDQSAPMNLEEANDRTLNLVLEGGEDTLRRASAANLKGTSDRTNNLLTRKETMRALKDRTTAVRRRNTMRQAQRTPNTIHEEHVPVARTMTYKDPDGNEDNDC